MPVMGQKQSVIDNISKLLQASRIFGVPVILTEQYPKWLGPTLPEITEHIEVYEPITKFHFNCCDEESFIEKLDSENIENIIIAGVETHICVFQTSVSLLKKGYNIHVPRDAVGSRTSENRQVGLDLMDRAGAFVSSTETVIYQLLKKAGTKEFKQILKIVK